MANVLLSTKAVGSIVKLNVNGAATDFIVVHQGKPGSIYDDSCNGVWLLMKDIYEKRVWNANGANDYENSGINAYLNETFLALFDPDIQDAIKQVKIPYRAGAGSSKTVTSGANGLSVKIFLLSSTECAFVNKYAPTDEGATLSYFSGCAATSADAKREARFGETLTAWWLRSPGCDATIYTLTALFVAFNGSYGSNGNPCTNANGIRPALVLPGALQVSGDGTVITNNPPTITSASGASGVNLGSKTAAFSFTYKVADADGDKLTVTEKLDGTTMKTRTNISSGTTLTFEYPSTAANFQKILNGSHVLTVEVSDGKKTATFKANFTKAVYEATITLKTPLAVAGDITAAVLSVVGDIPAGAIYKVEVTNNAKDTSPAWQDVTSEVKSGVNIVFTNKTAANGAAFNFRITVKRGTSTGGYISGVGGAFQ